MVMVKEESKPRRRWKKRRRSSSCPQSRGRRGCSSAASSSFTSASVRCLLSVYLPLQLAPFPNLTPTPTPPHKTTQIPSEVGYGGWIASVLLLEHLTDSPAQASYAVACFWFTITAGRVAAIGLSALLPPRRLLLGQMALLTVGAVLLAITLPLHTLPGTTTAGAVFGLGMSSVFPTMLSLPREMGYSLDVHSTGRVLVAACLGEGLLPVAMGEVMRAVGTGAFPYCVLVGVAGMWLLAMALLLPRWLPSCCRPRGGGGAGLSSQQQQLQQKGFEMMRREEEEKEGGVGRGLSVGIAG